MAKAVGAGPRHRLSRRIATPSLLVRRNGQVPRTGTARTRKPSRAGAHRQRQTSLQGALRRLRANPAMARYARHYLDLLQAEDEPDLAFDVRKVIYLLLPMGRATIEHIAPALGMNVRTLQRRLEECGVTFGKLINNVRFDLVIRYLDNPDLSLGEIADMLGYSMPSSFTRWFIANFGQPPAAWRAARRAANRSTAGAGPRSVFSTTAIAT